MSDVPLLVPVDVGFTVDVDGEVIPTVAVDVTDHPSVADLARVHALDGIGDVRTGGTRIRDDRHDVLVLGVVLTVPVRAAFGIAFTLPAHTEFVESVATHGRLAIATTDPGRAADEHPTWLAVDVEAGPLRALLAEDR